jgi:hypothetical protein
MSAFKNYFKGLGAQHAGKIVWFGLGVILGFVLWADLPFAGQ